MLTKQISIRLPQQLLTGLDKLAGSYGRQRSDVIRIMLENQTAKELGELKKKSARRKAPRHR